MAERDEVQALFNREATAEAPPTLEEFPMGGDYGGSLADFSKDHLALKAAGVEDGLLPPDEVAGPLEREPLFNTARDPIFEPLIQSPRRNPSAAFNEIFSNALITGDATDMGEKMDQAKLGTVQDELVETLVNDYQDEEFRLNQLTSLHEMPKDEQVRVLNYELDRRDAQKITAREALLIHVHRAGHGDMTTTQFDKVYRAFNPVELDQFRQQLRTQQTEELRNETNKVVARTDIGSTTQAVGDFIAQDLLPIYNVASRMFIANTLKNAVDAEVGWFRSIFPGEVRQEVRETFAAASPEERLQYVRDMGDAIETLKNGPLGPYITEYGILENYMEIYTEDLMVENLPKNTLDRVLGNMDVVLESVFNVGLIVKAGGRTVKQAYRTTNTIQGRRTARAAGNHKLREKLDSELQLVIREAGGDPADAALVHLPKPPLLGGEREVLPASLKDVVERGERLRSEILIKSDDLTGIGLNTDEKVNIVRKELDELDSHDTMAVNPQMSVLEALPNDTGFKYTAVYGQSPTQGWDDLRDVVDELLDVDPNVENFRIVKRNKNGELERIELTPDEFARLAVKGEIPKSLLPPEPGQRLVAEMINGRPVHTLADDQLIELSAAVPQGSREFEILAEEARRRANGLPVPDGDALRAYDGDEFFLEVDHERFFHTLDKEVFDANTWRNTPGWIPRSLIPPSQTFGDEIFASFDRAYRIEQATIAKFEEIYQPYYALSKEDKEIVTGAMEYIEKYAKDHGEMPSIAHLYSQMDGLTTDQLGGILSLQQGLNTQWEMFNRRLFREWKNAGYRSATPRVDGLPAIHGKALEVEELGSGRTVYNPATQKQEVLSRSELQDFYNGGGQIYKIDLAMDVPGEAGKANTLIKVDPADYRMGKLNTSVLEYHPGYYSRFYEDPFYIIKRSGKEVDGTKTDLVEDAIRTAGSVEEAERFVRRFANFDPKRGVWVNATDPSKTYRIQRAAQLDQVESSLFAKQALHREGRLFWDKRNYDRLPDVNGNRAALEDPTEALWRSTVMATRQTTHEDLMKSIKTAMGNEFKDILPDNYLNTSISDVIEHLKTKRRAAAEPALKVRYDKALEMAKYIRLQQGTDSLAVPFLREQVVKLAGGISRLAGRAPSPLITKAGFKMSKVLENMAANLDPFRTLRSAAFHAFMVFRPARQLLLQSAQISFLSALDPLYIGSGRVIKDGLLLRRGVAALRKTGYEDGMSKSKAAKLMGLSKKQYSRLVDEFDRSGLLDTVDVHAFAGGSHKSRRQTKGLQTARQLRDWSQKVGFDTGEMNNLSFTYMVSMRRVMRKEGIDDLMKLSKSQWDEIGNQAQQLALGMTKPNKMQYQAGALGNFTQFLSFSHKAVMTLLGQNPAISKLEAIKMSLATYTLFGANMFGAGEWARAKLNDSALEKWADKHLDGWGGTLSDLIAFGVAQKALNTVFRAIEEEHKDIDLGFLAPGINTVQIWEHFYEAAMESPITGLTGPGGQVVGTFVNNADIAGQIWRYGDMSVEDKAIRSMDMLLRTFPQYNDAMTGLIAYQTQRWVNSSGKALPLEFEPVWTGMVARGLVGARTTEELAWYQLNGDVWQTKENMQNMIEANRDYMLKQLGLYYAGEVSDEFIKEQFMTLGAMAEAWPEHYRMEIFRQSMVLENQEGMSVLKFLAENTKMLTPDITALLDQLPDMPQGARDELEEFLNEVYNERVENNKQFMQEELQDSELWQN